MLGLYLGVFQILSLVTGNPLDSGRYLIDSQPLMFLDDSESESQVVNSTLVLKKKENSVGPVYYTDKRQEDIVNNHHIDAEGVVWKRPYRPVSDVFSNHKGDISWNRRKTTTTITTKAPQAVGFENRLPVKQVTVNNHNPSLPVRNRPIQQSSAITVVNPLVSAPTEILGARKKPEDTIKSATIKVLNAPTNVKTTVKKIQNSKIIVIQKRLDQRPSSSSQKGTTIKSTIYTKPTEQSTYNPTQETIFQTQTETPDMGNFSVAPVMDMWSNIPIPSRPAWAPPNKPVKGGVSRPTAVQSPVVPHLPFMGFLTSLLTPLLTKPLSSSTVTSGMQGIKAMQGFLRRSLMGAMFCFLPSAFIALSLTATQRAQLRKIPEIDNMMVFCKKCLENLKEIKELAKSKELSWMNESL